VTERIIDHRRRVVGLHPEVVETAPSIRAIPRQITGAMPITAFRPALSRDLSMERHRTQHQRLRTLG
jgi:hypothetical protein